MNSLVEKVKELSPQQQKEVLIFIDSLQEKAESESVNEPQEKTFGEVAAKYIGCLDGGPSDLSTNKAYMEGFGEV